MADTEATQEQEPRLREVRRRQRAEDVDEGQGPEGAELVEKIADGGSATEAQIDSATDWLLSDDPAVAPSGHRVLKVNVGTDEDPHDIAWTIRAIDGAELREVQRAVNNPRSLRRGGGEPDQMEMHARVVVRASIDPDVAKIGREKGAGAAHRFLMDRFAHKPGLIPQLSAEIMQLSGFDDTHVQEVDPLGKQQSAMETASGK